MPEVAEPGLVITRVERGEVTSIRLEGFLDAHTAPDLDKEIKYVMGRGTTRIVANLTRLDYISSAGLGVFMSHVESLRADGGDLRLCGLIPKVRRVFDIVGFSRVFELDEEEESSVEGFAGKGAGS